MSWRPMVLALLILCTASLMAQDFAYREGYLLETRGMSLRGPAELRVAGHTFRRNDKIVIEIRFTNFGGADQPVYNPFFNPLLRFPAALAVYDADRRYLGDYLTYLGGSRAGIGSGSWVTVPTNGFVGTSLTRSAGLLPQVGENKVLPAGRYYLQMIYFNAFIGYDSKGGRMFNPDEGHLMIENFDTSELFRSNIVEVEFID